jgi:hypothetical protein
MIYLYKRGTGMGRIARDLSLSTFLVPDSKTTLRRHNAPFINWGSIRLPEIIQEKDAAGILNYDIREAASKRKTFDALSRVGIRIPRWDTDGNALHKTLVKDGRSYMLARRDGLSKGAGIKIISLVDDKIPQADFYVEKLSCQREFRAHVWGGKVICLQAKMVPPGCDNFIHNFENGCRYTTQMLERWLTDKKEMDNINSTAIKSVKALGLHFGAVDLLLNKRGYLYVLEVNTAPGLRSDVAYLAYKTAIIGEKNADTRP